MAFAGEEIGSYFSYSIPDREHPECFNLELWQLMAKHIVAGTLTNKILEDHDTKYSQYHKSLENRGIKCHR